MNSTTGILSTAILIGSGGAALIDLWSLALRRAFHVTTLDYALLGRWIGHFRSGRFLHTRIAAAPRVRGERFLGWTAHYAIGVGFALVLLALFGTDWAGSPTIVPALLVGLGSIAAPWFIMQPAFGAGIAGSRTANPAASRLRNLGTHTVYGLGLYLSAVLLSAF
ncbi:hypothetical protein AYO38_11530 [bacterium SCGC AG-212-C10]|nr:hypothetical protein AYO38_11530 [bacterium SCGC AG-212-C10]